MNLIIDDQEVYAQQVSNYIDVICRANSKEDWELATSGKLLDETTLLPLNGVLLDVIGSVELQDGTFDTRYHVNVRFYESFDWQSIILQWMYNGSTQEDRNNLEEAVSLAGVSIIDAGSITSPSRVWGN